MAELGEGSGPLIHPLAAGRTTFGKLPSYALAASGAALLAAAILLVDGSPGPPLGFLLGRAPALVGFLDMLGLALLLVRIGGFITAGHGALLTL